MYSRETACMQETIGLPVRVNERSWSISCMRGKRAKKPLQLFIKRSIDIVLSFILLIFLMPLFVIVAVVIKMTSEGPVLYKQKRCGCYGRIFILYKFRTMIDGAEMLLPCLREKNAMNGPAFKMENDPRVTAVGKYLRKFSIDELPQFWNVLKGDMSLIGPRPHLPEEAKEYDRVQQRRLSMRPGMTCLWQVKGRSTIRDFDEWIRLDLHYIDHWSLWCDLKILFQTIVAVSLTVGAL